MPVTRVRALLPSTPEIHFVEGTGSRRAQQARDDVKGVDLALIWGPTELSHKASLPYMRLEAPHAHKVLVANRRGVAALLDTASLHLETGGRVRG